MAGRYRALLIGNSTYPADEHNLQTLRGPVKDIAVLNRALADRETGLFADVDVTLLPEATSTRAVRALGAFFTAADRDDVLLVYFSGHGKLDQMGRLHLCMNDTETTDLLSTAVSSVRINEFADASRARNVVIILDCCYAGAFRGGDFGDAVAGPGRYVMTSCRGTQLANDATVDNGTSFFTQHLVEGLLQAADQDGDGYVSFSDVYAHVDRCLREDGKQIPQRRVDGDGDLRLARRPPGGAAAGSEGPAVPRTADGAGSGRLAPSAVGDVARPVSQPPRTDGDASGARAFRVPEPGVLQVGLGVDAVAFSPDGTRLATGFRRRVRLWDLRARTTIWERQVGGSLLYGVWAVAFSPDGARLATSTGGNTARIWDVATGQQQLELKHPGRVCGVAFSPDGTRLATGSWDHSARIWDSAAGHQRLEVNHAGNVNGVAFSPDGTRLATASADKTARVWSVANGQQQLEVKHTDVVLQVAFSPDGTRLATASADKTARIWDAATGRIRLEVKHTGCVYGVAFSPDGTRLATACADKTARIWDSTTGQQQLQPGHTGPVYGVAFSPDGTRLATASADKTARIWDVTIE